MTYDLRADLPRSHRLPDGRRYVTYLCPDCEVGASIILPDDDLPVCWICGQHVPPRCRSQYAPRWPDEPPPVYPTRDTGYMPTGTGGL